jgi:hypothetical protein
MHKSSKIESQGTIDTSKHLKIVQRVDLKKMNNKTQMDQKTNNKKHRNLLQGVKVPYIINKHTEDLQVLLPLEMELDTQIREHNRMQ